MVLKLVGRLAGLGTLAAFLAFGGGATVASASAGGAASNLQCFTGLTTMNTPGYGGTCSLSTHGSIATLSETTGNPNGTFSGVFLHKRNLSGEPLSAISKLGYTWADMAPGTTPTPTPGDLSLNIGLSKTAGGTTTAYVYIDAFDCPGTTRLPGNGGTGGTVTVVNASNCGMYYEGTFFRNWSSLIAAYPNATVGKTAIPFIVAERVPHTPAAVWQISRVYLGTLGS
jgi:hypothetical protein